MKKIFIAIQALFAYLFLVIPAFAQTAITEPQGVNPCKDSATSTNAFTKAVCGLGGNISGTLGNIVVAVVVLAVIIALLYLLYGGIRWVTSRGDKEQVEGARNHIVAAIVGLVVVFLAVFIVSIVLGIFGLKLGDLTIPKIVP